MSVRYECDRCGKLMEPEPNPPSTVTFSRVKKAESKSYIPRMNYEYDRVVKEMDLCEDCAEKLQKFLEGKE